MGTGTGVSRHYEGWERVGPSGYNINSYSTGEDFDGFIPIPTGKPFPRTCRICGKDFVAGDTVNINHEPNSAEHLACAAPLRPTETG